MAFKIPSARLPTDPNEAQCIGGGFFAVDQNGYMNMYDGTKENWVADTVQLTAGQWMVIVVRRDHAAKTTDLWINSRKAFTAIPISGPDLANFIRYTLTSVGEYDTWVDLLIGYPNSPF